MRKLIVSNFLTLDGYYESASKTFDRFFDYFHEDYGANEAFDEYNTELLRGAGTLILSGRTSFLANKDYWVSYPDTPGGTAIRREFAELIRATEKYVVSDTIAPEDLAPWQDTARIIRGADLYAEIAALRPRHPRCGRGQETEVGRDAGVDRRPPVVFRDLYYRALSVAEHRQRRA